MNQSFHKRRKAIVVGNTHHQLFYQLHIGYGFTPSQGVTDQLRTQCSLKQMFLLFQMCPQPVSSRNQAVIVQLSGCLDGLAVSVRFPPAAECVVLLKSESQWIDPGMTIQT